MASEKKSPANPAEQNDALTNATNSSSPASDEPSQVISLTVKTRRVQKVYVRDFFEAARSRLQMEVVAGEEGLDNEIGEKSLNRPALALTGYFKHFGSRRLQLFGAGEISYLSDLRPETQKVVLEEIFKKNIPGMIVSRGLYPTPTMVELAELHKVPILRSRMKSKDFSAEATLLLDQKFALRSSLHGTLIDARGVGVLLRGESGVGKSECALALIERGYSLVADDYVLVRLVGENTLVGTGKEVSRGFMECRGLGIIDVASMFGIRAVRHEKNIDLVVSFTPWKEGMDEDRTGLEMREAEILGCRVPLVELAVRPGRDMARLVEVAVMIYSLRRSGHDPARDFDARLLRMMNPPDDASE